ncbi:MAG: hypothetical protein Q4E35_09235 [Eubacteriales bacterium]|nr:hypothetical protein [Eubacteriales bacterium]
MKFKAVFKKILFALVSVLMLHLSVRYLGFAMSPKFELDCEGKAVEVKELASYFFSSEKRNSADTLFIGSSHVYCGIDVNIMNRVYGKNALMLSTSSQTLDLSYYAIMSAIPLQRPDTIYLETFCVRLDEQQPKPLSSRALLNDLPNWSRGKLQAARASGLPMYYYLYPITDLHDTWFKLTAKDFLLPKLPEGERYSFHFDRVCDNGDFSLSYDIKDAEISESTLDWLNKIVALCRENDTRLVLFTVPYPASSVEQAQFRALDSFARSNGLTYYNLVDDYEKIGIDFHTDFFDNQHMNTSGQEKLSRYIAENCME